MTELRGAKAPAAGVPEIAGARLHAPRRRALHAAAWILAAVAGFAVYLQLARTRGVNSDGAGNALQAWAMLHGNPLLRGWRLSDVSFYTTELPEYMLVELVRGLNTQTVQIAAAITYTLTVLAAALLARSTATGREAVARACVAAWIMLAPQPGYGINVLISSPDHLGTSVAVIAAWLLLDHDRGRRRRWVAVAVPLLLGWAVAADELVIYIGVIPLAAVCAYRVLRSAVGERRVPWYECVLAVGALAAARLALLAQHLIHAGGGFLVTSPPGHLASLHVIVYHNLRATADGLLLLGGANFIGLHTSAGIALAALHLTGVAVAVWAVARTVWRWRRDDDPVAQVILGGIAVNVAAYLFSAAPGPDVLPTSREMAPVLALSAGLAGRQLGPVLARATKRAAGIMAPVVALVAAGYLLGLAHEAVQPKAPDTYGQLAAWLRARHLTDGLSGYWDSNVVTLASGDRVRIRLVEVGGGTWLSPDQRKTLIPGNRETNGDWYNPGAYSANFVVLFPGVSAPPGYPGFKAEDAAISTFGQPVRVYHYGKFTILVWNKNLLAQLIGPLAPRPS